MKCSARCKSPPGASICIEYDPTMAAVTMEEAIVQFRDPTVPEELTLVFMLYLHFHHVISITLQTNETSTGVDCDPDDMKCMECKEEFLDWISNGDRLIDFEDEFNVIIIILC